MAEAIDYKTYMIQMSDNPVSQMYRRSVLKSWKKYNESFVDFEAVTPKDLVYRNELKFGIKKSKSGKRDFTLTEKAVWYSHFDLWCLSIRKRRKILVIEHDSKLVKPLPDLSKEGYKFLSFNKGKLKNRVTSTSKHTGSYRSLTPGSGYYIVPAVAERLVANAVANTININSDGFIATILNFKAQKKMDDYYYIEQINFDGLNTIDHRTSKRKYIGLDYEDIDLSSVHRQA